MVLFSVEYQEESFFSFSNRNEPNRAQTLRMIRMGSVRDCFLDLLSLTEMNRTVSKTFGFFGWVRLEIVFAAMSCLSRPARWWASMAAVILSFCLETKGPKIQGRHQGPAAHGNRSSPMSAGPARPTRSVFGVPNLSERSSHVVPEPTCTLVGIYGCGIYPPISI